MKALGMPVQAVILIGVQGAGKTKFYQERFFRTHVRISLDMLRTRRRERILLQACIQARQRFVVDNTNPTRADRQRYIAPARAAGFEVVGYYFRVSVQEALTRNASRPADEQVPSQAIWGTYRRLEEPSLDEGFDALFVVRIDEEGTFVVVPWSGQDQGKGGSA